MIKEKWDLQWDARSGPSKMDYLRRHLSKKMAKIVKSGYKVLEIGCSDGFWLEFFSKRGIDIIGVDISDNAIKLAKMRDQNLRVIKADARDLPFKDSSFDFVFSLGVVEHFEETQDAINEHVRVSRNIVLITVPNLLAIQRLPYYIISYLKRRKMGNWIDLIGKMYTPTEFYKMLKIAGLEDISIRTIDVRPLIPLISLERFPNNIIDRICDKIEDKISKFNIHI